jgi:hypothetical protein
MSGYLQRLLASAAPASEPTALTPVDKSTSPIFEQNQLPGLAGFSTEEELGVAPQVADAPDAARAPISLPPAAAPASPKIIRRDPLPVTPTPAPRPAVGFAPAETPLPTLRSTVDATPTHSLEPSDTARRPVRPTAESVEPSLRLETAARTEPEHGSDAPATLEPLPSVFAPAEAGLAPVPSERVASGAARTIEPRAVLQPEEGNARVTAVALDEPREPAPSKPLADAPPGPVVLEPRPRPAFDDVDPDADQPRPQPQQVPRITIGRVTVALEPALGPATSPLRTPRTAATASVIGPIGNRRARRRLFALARL